ncbi:MAG: hypothetical protein ABID32_04050 [Candidatus Omnitrophota bacterium]
MATPEKYINIMQLFDKAQRNDDYSEIDKIPPEDLKKAKHHLIKDKNMPWYSLLIDKIKEHENITPKTNIIPCGPLAKNQCDVKAKINGKNIFLDIPYTKYEDCEKALRDLLKERDLIPVVAKDRLTSNAILCKVCALIKTCKYGITDLSSASHNVTYEYGLMHGLGMKVCLTMRSTSETFTDIHGLEHIPYSGLRSFKIAITKWLSDNVEEVNKTKTTEIIKTEEEILKEKGDIELKKIEVSYQKEDKEIQDAKNLLIEETRNRANNLKKNSKGKPTRIIYSIPTIAKDVIVSPRKLFNKKEACVLLSPPQAGFTWETHDLKTSQTSLLYHLESELRSNLPLFEFFEANIYGLVFLEESVYEYGKDDFKKVPQDELLLDVYVTLNQLYKFVLLINNFYKKISYSGLIDLNYIFQNVKGLKLLSKYNYGFTYVVGKIDYQEVIPIKRVVETDKLAKNPEDIILSMYEEFRGAGNVENAYARDITKWQLEEVKWQLYGQDVCSICKKNYKPKNRDKCLDCLEKSK